MSRSSRTPASRTVAVGFASTLTARSTISAIRLRVSAAVKYWRTRLWTFADVPTYRTSPAGPMNR